MHAVRRQAHRTASHRGANGSIIYNPFSRPWPRLQAYDEQNLTRARSETDQIPANQEQRGLEDGEAAKEFGAPQPHFPEPGPYIPATTDPDVATYRTERETSDQHKDDPHIDIDSTGGVTKRGKFKKLLKGKHEYDDFDDETLANQTSEELSVEERKRKAHKRKIPMGQQLRYILFGHWLLLLMPFVPAGFVLRYIHASAAAIFCVNFVAIIPSATILGSAVRDLSIRSGDKVAALLNMTFGNAVQLILSALLLRSHQIDVLKLSLLGTILSNLTLMTGASFVCGGWNRPEQFFNVMVAQSVGSALLLAVASLVIPSAAHLLTETSDEGMRAQSRGISFVCLVSYGLWLLFSLWTHKESFTEPSQKVPRRKPSKLEEGEAVRGVAAIGASTAAASGGGINLKNLLHNQPFDEGGYEEEFETPALSYTGAFLTLIVSVVLVAFNTEFATDSIQQILLRRKVSKTFLSLIVLPVLSNDPLAISMAIKDNMDMSISLTLERCLQTTTLVIPLAVLLAWCMGINEMDLKFDAYPIAILFVAMVIVNSIIVAGKNTWLVLHQKAGESITSECNSILNQLTSKGLLEDVTKNSSEDVSQRITAVTPTASQPSTAVTSSLLASVAPGNSEKCSRAATESWDDGELEAQSMNGKFTAEETSADELAWETPRPAKSTSSPRSRKKTNVRRQPKAQKLASAPISVRRVSKPTRRFVAQIQTIEWVFWIQVSDGVGYWRPLADFPNATQTQFKRKFDMDFVQTPRHIKLWMTMLSKREKYLDRDMCVGNVTYWGRNEPSKWKKALGDKEKTCDTCFKAGRFCARMVKVGDVVKLGFFPTLDAEKTAVNWRKIRHWIGEKKMPAKKKAARREKS
ncbi:hypothetical protein E8E11_006961 [Didymella keratinophila]|nr:hypothetical protein E8E11_006961 [Didymella keratinophila]